MGRLDMDELLNKVLPPTTQSPLRWRQAWNDTRFRTLAVTGVLLLAALLAMWPWYLGIIEARNGLVLADLVLQQLPRFDVSLPVFFCLWGAALLLIYRAQQSPLIFLRFIWAYALLFITRIISIGLTPLDPPPGLIELRDPLSNYFYGEKFITKDLFFSGHTASICLMALCLVRPPDRWLVFVGTSIVGVGVLIQRVHYTIDVATAPFFAYLIYQLTLKLLRRAYPGQVNER